MQSGSKATFLFIIARSLLMTMPSLQHLVSRLLILLICVNSNLKAETMVPNVGMAVLMDAGMEKGIHPARKRVVGERLARLALVNDYGVEGVMAQSACYKKWSKE